MNTIITALLLIVSVALGYLRVSGSTGAAFQAVAHLYVGGLIGAAIRGGSRRWLCAGLAASLSVLEVLCFLLLRK